MAVKKKKDGPRPYSSCAVRPRAQEVTGVINKHLIRWASFSCHFYRVHGYVAFSERGGCGGEKKNPLNVKHDKLVYPQMCFTTGVCNQEENHNGLLISSETSGLESSMNTQYTGFHTHTHTHTYRPTQRGLLTQLL